MSGGGKGGSSKTKVEIPKWLEAAAQKNMARADKIAQIGYVPYYGPDVAAFSPMQQSAFQNQNNAMSAFGLAAPSDPMSGMPQAQTFANGVTGYSSAPLYQQSVDALKAARPGQYNALMAPFINPVTGAAPAQPFGTSGGTAGGTSPINPITSLLSGKAFGGSDTDYSNQIHSGATYSTTSDRDRQGTTPYQQAYNDQMSFLSGGNDRPSGMGGGK